MTKREKQRMYANHVEHARRHEKLAREFRKAARKLEPDVLASLKAKR